MKTILVDDEIWGLKKFEIECANMDQIDVVGQFQNPLEALEYAEEHRVDLAFLDIEMPVMNGLELSEKLRELYPDIIIIFVSAYDEHMPEAFRNQKADYFVLKPYTEEEIREVLGRAKLLSQRQKRHVEIHTFGMFDVYVDGKLLKFTSPKAKELLAVLVDHNGQSVTSETAFSIMWSEKEYNHTEAAAYRRALSKLQKTLKDAGIEDILTYSPRSRAIRPEKVECDYFDLMKEKPEAIQKYLGCYMSEYAWGEERIYLLNYIKLKKETEAEEILYQ